MQREYVALGVAAMRGRWWGVSGEGVVMSFRSLPGLPLYLALHESSGAHYRAFSQGELAAYLHLSSEQGLEDGLRMIEDLGRRDVLPDADIVQFLDSFKLPAPIVTDAGAIASVRRLLADTQRPPRPFLVRGDLIAALRRHIEQHAVTMAVLDDDIRRDDLELWRTKQVSDFLAGVWAQGYGQIYVSGIDWLIRIRNAARVALVVTLALLAWLVARPSVRPRAVAAEP